MNCVVVIIKIFFYFSLWYYLTSFTSSPPTDMLLAASVLYIADRPGIWTCWHFQEQTAGMQPWDTTPRTQWRFPFATQHVPVMCQLLVTVEVHFNYQGQETNYPYSRYNVHALYMYTKITRCSLLYLHFHVPVVLHLTNLLVCTHVRCNLTFQTWTVCQALITIGIYVQCVCHSTVSYFILDGALDLGEAPWDLHANWRWGRVSSEYMYTVHTCCNSIMLIIINDREHMPGSRPSAIRAQHSRQTVF